VSPELVGTILTVCHGLVNHQHPTSRVATKSSCHLGKKMNSLLWLKIILFSIVVTGCTSGENSTSGNNPDPGPGTSILPPDPGEAGKATLEGIDSDSDGVRDDVQIAIHDRYPTDELTRNALTQQAIALQDAVVTGNSSDVNAMNQASKSVIDAIDCLHESVTNPSSELSFLEVNVMNTPDRSQAYITFNEASSGQFFGDGDAGNPCQ